MKESYLDDEKVSKPREYTVEEVRNQFLKYMVNMVDYCDENPEETSREKLLGLLFSFLVLLDGEAVNLPGFAVIPSPHEDDKEYHIENGENYYPKAKDTTYDIAGSLHDLLYEFIKNE